jgi:hypothetical protein
LAVAVGRGFVVVLIIVAVEQIVKRFHFVPALEAKLAEILAQAIGQSLALKHDGDERALAGVDERRLAERPSVDAIEQELLFAGKIDDRQLLRADRLSAA